MTDLNQKLIIPNKKEDFIPFSKELIKKYGDKSKSLSWLRKNGYGAFISRVRKLYGKWSIFTFEANFINTEVNNKKIWTPGTIKTTFKKLIEDHGEEVVNSSTWLRKNGYSGLASAITKNFGSLLKFQEEIGLKKNIKTKKWEKEIMIPLIKELVSKNGENNLTTKWLTQNGYSGFLDAVGREYGGLNNLKVAAGFPVKKIKTYKDWDKNDLIPFLKLNIEEYGDQALSSKWFLSQGHGTFVEAVRCNYDRSWSNFIKDFGIENKWDKKKLINHMKKLLDKHGDKALSCEWLRKKTIDNGSFMHAIKNEYGTWTEFKKKNNFGQLMEPRGTFAKLSKSEVKRFILDLRADENIRENALNTKWLKTNGYSGYVGQVINLWGRWNSFISELDCAPLSLKTKDELKNIFLELKEIHGDKILTTRGLKEVDESLLYSIKKQFKNWGDFRKEVDINPPTPRGTYDDLTKDDCITKIKEFFAKYGENGLSSQFLSNELKQSGFINKTRKLFGSWGEARRTAGFESAYPIHEIRKGNYKKIKNILKALKNHVRALEPRDIYILLQQHDLTDLPRNQGGILVQRLLGGDLPFEAIEDWLDNQNDIPEDTNQSVSNVNNEDSEEDNSHEDDLDEEIDDQNEDQSQMYLLSNDENSSGNETQDLPEISSNDALDILNSNVWATDDNEAAESLICSALDKVWNHAYKDQEEATNQIEKFEGNKWCQILKERFFEIYNRAKKLSVPENYIFPHQPRLMQKVAAVEAMKRSRLLILSGMGLGKTLASTLAVQSANSKVVWVICPNNTINGWEDQLNEQWNNIEIFKKEFSHQVSNQKTKYFLLNFERFSTLKDSEISEIISKSCPDAIIIDEVQFAKQRTLEYTSQRRKQISKCILFASELNPKLMVIGMSGTPILNNLMEGRKLIELIFSEDREDLKVENNFHNAMRMFQEFARLGIRQRSNDIWPTELIKYPINVTHLLDKLKQVRASSTRSMADYEKLLIAPKFPYILDICKKQPTLVITEFITGIVEPLRKILEKAGLKIGIYTGTNKYPTFGGFKNSLEEFKAGATDVLIGSSDCLGTGIDGLQDICNHMIYATLPWTEGDNAQIQARLARERQIHEVFIHLPQTFLYFSNKKGDQKRWSFCEYRWSIIESKKALASAAVDGVSPSSDKRLTPNKALNYIDGWIDRLDNEEVVYRYGRQIKVPLVIKNDSEETNLRRKFGDFNKTNRLWNNTSSHKTHMRLVSDPQEWELYHSDLLEKRKTWQVDPLSEVIKFCRERKGSIFADFGCGTGDLAKEISEESEIYSFDHIAINSSVIECDIGQGVFLEDESIDFAIFSLSLMGSNWRDYLKEARRCLKPNGQIVIWNPLDQSINKEISNVLKDIGFQEIQNEQRWKWRHIWCICVPKKIKD